ncbi:MAG: hypothetical protein ACLSUV_08830 [Bacilli bacterium]|mgnify:FL=1
MKNMNIEAVLSYGKVFTGRKKYFFNFLCYFCMALFVVCLIITALIIISEEIIDENMIFCISVIVIFSFVLFLVALYLLVKNNRILKKIDLYLNDAILVSAKVERWDKIDISYKPYQVKVFFEFKNQKKVMISAPGNAIMGYNKIFSKFDGKVVDVLYSDSNQQILFIK